MMERTFPHSIELRAFLLMHNNDTNIVGSTVRSYGRFCGRWGDSAYPVSGKPSDDGIFRAAFEEAFDASDVTLKFVSRSALARTPALLVSHFNTSARQELVRELLDDSEHDEASRGAKKMKLFGRSLYDVVSSTFDCRRLRIGLDHSFGDSFGRLIMDDIMTLWLVCFSHILLRQTRQATRLEKLIDVERTNPVIGRSQDNPNCWLLWSF